MKRDYLSTTCYFKKRQAISQRERLVDGFAAFTIDRCTFTHLASLLEEALADLVDGWDG
jgi:hypothetical protein